MGQLSKVMDHIDGRAAFLSDATSEFIRTPSISGSEGQVATLLSRRAAELEMESKIDAIGNVVCLFRGRQSAAFPRLAFNVHLDHVPPGDPASWRYDPYSGKVADGRIYGRGASDTKGAWAPMLLAMEAVQRNGGVDGDVLFTAVVMEELTQCAGMRHLLDVTLRDSKPDFMVSGEGTSLNVAIGHRGRTEIEFICRGKAAHASAPWRGQNALYKASGVIASLEKLSRELAEGESHPLLGRATLAVTDIDCSPGSRNVVPSLCKVYADYRFLPDEDATSILERVGSHLRADNLEVEVGIVESEEVSYTGFRFRGQKFMPGFIISKSDPLVEATAESAWAVIHSTPKIQRWDFATDGGHSMGVGIPTVGLSPCEEELAHTDNEYVRLDYMLKAAKIYAEIILRLCRSRQ